MPVKPKSLTGVQSARRKWLAARKREKELEKKTIKKPKTAQQMRLRLKQIEKQLDAISRVEDFATFLKSRQDSRAAYYSRNGKGKIVAAAKRVGALMRLDSFRRRVINESFEARLGMHGQGSEEFLKRIYETGQQEGLAYSLKPSDVLFFENFYEIPQEKRIYPSLWRKNSERKKYWKRLLTLDLSEEEASKMGIV